jgi:phosphoserine phosphatase RsbU/P
MRILIAEDDFTSRTVLTSVLKREGYEVTATVNGAAAWQVLQQPDAPELAILDWMMPEINGLELVRRVRAIPTDRPPYLVMLSTKGDKDDVIAGLEAGANDYLAKPFHVGELRVRIGVGRRLVEMQAALADNIVQLRQALEQINSLRGILPICMHCKRIRNDKGYWHQLEVYISHHSEATFSHGICPECVTKHYPEFSQLPDDGAGNRRP